MIHTILFPNNIADAWEQMLPVLSKAIEFGDTHSEEDVKALLLCGNAQAWVQFSDKIEVAVVTEFVRYPLKTRLRIWLAGAIIGVSPDWEKFQSMLVEYAEKNGCNEIEELGRIGWERKFPFAQKRRQEIVYKIKETNK